MADLSDVDMTGVKAMSDYVELPAGQYLMRIEDTDRIMSKEKFDKESGQKMPDSYYLMVRAVVYGGEHEYHAEIIRLNLWNTNEDAVRMAKSERKSIEEAIGVVSTNSDDWHGKFMVIEVREYEKRDKTKATKRIYTPAPADVIAMFVHLPPVPAKPPSQAATKPAFLGGPKTTTAPVTAAPAAAGSVLPDWAKPKAKTA